MMTRFAALIAGAALLAGSSLGSAQSNKAAQTNNPNTWSAQELRPIVNSVRKQLLSLPDYDLFDWLTFSIQGRSVILHGYASRPQLKSEAEKVVKGIKGVQSVQNDIKVLPYSPMDDQIRIQEMVRIYGQPALRKYTNAPIQSHLYPTVGRMAGGITEDPPVGYFAIHIIVNNGHVILEGVVDSAMDAEIADAQANSVPGVFSVTDDLLVPGKPQKEKVK
jgi:hyperosmotically inducible protein